MTVKALKVEMGQRVLTHVLDRLGRFYPAAVSAFSILFTIGFAAGYSLLLTAYVNFTLGEFIRFLIFAVAVVAVATTLSSIFRGIPWRRPVRRWLAGHRSTEETEEAWRTAVSMPLDFVRKVMPVQLLTIALPVAVYGYFALDLDVLQAMALYLGACGAVAYGFVLLYFQLELGMRPVVVRISESMSGDFGVEPRVVSLKWKLLAGLPALSIITGLVVAALTSDDKTGLMGLGFDALVAVAVAFTISLELTILLSRSILIPVHELVEAAQRVSKGDLDVRVPITSNDEVGVLARNFNEMVSGIAERERLREAFGSYVDPEIAERVMEEGELLKGEEVQVTVVFFDIRGFTAIAAGSRPREVVNLLNSFYDCVVPVLHRHGGHANKFVGDGLLAVFGAPEHYRDHADRALRAAVEVLRAIEDRFGDELEVGAGINSGRVIAGSIGGGGRLEFAVIGDAVNVAARIEEFTRSTGDSLLLSEATYELLSDRSKLEPREQADLKGRDEPVQLYSLKAEKGAERVGP